MIGAAIGGYILICLGMLHPNGTSTAVRVVAAGAIGAAIASLRHGTWATLLIVALVLLLATFLLPSLVSGKRYMTEGDAAKVMAARRKAKSQGFRRS